MNKTEVNEEGVNIDPVVLQLRQAWPRLPITAKLYITWLVWLEVQKANYRQAIQRIKNPRG